MCCLMYLNDIIGKDCVCYFFWEMFNVYMIGQVFVLVVCDVYGEGLQFYQFYVDYSWGQIQQVLMEQFMIDVVGWEQVELVVILFGIFDYLMYFLEVQSLGVDVFILNYYGFDGVNFMQQVIDVGIDEDMEIIVLLYNCLMVQVVGGVIEGIYGIVVWDLQIDNMLLQEFMQVF